VVLGFITKPLTMIRLFAELFGHYQSHIHAITSRAVPKIGRGDCCHRLKTWRKLRLEA
jgi:hypothetical protein